MVLERSPQLRQQLEQVARTACQLGAQGEPGSFCSLILFCYFHNLRQDLDKLFQLVNVNVTIASRELFWLL